MSVLPAPFVPSPKDLAAYRAGTLSISRFEEVDAWLGGQPPEIQERLLGAVGEPVSDGDGEPVSNSADHLAPPELPGGTFTPEIPQSRFSVISPLGAGGMGIVDLVHDRVLDRDVALKRCRPRGVAESVSAHALRLRLFRREAAITARLAHPGIVPVHDVGLASAGEPAYLMKRLTGTTLAQRAPLPPAEAADVLLRVADAVGFAHQLGIVHRDLKPEHVWLGAAGETLVIDWGLAGAVGTVLHDSGASPATGPVQPGGVIGTPPWCAPEMTASSPADPRMDVWALGALLRFALTGCAPDQSLPFSRRTIRGLGAVAAHCQQADARQRYANGAEVAADLRRWLRDGLALAEDPAWPVRAVIASRQLMKRRPVVVVMGAVVLLILVGGLGLRQQARAAATQQALTLLGTPTPDAAGLRRWQAELAELPETGAVHQARVRTTHALQVEVLTSLARRYAHQGSWPTEVAELSAALREAGCDPLNPSAAATLNSHPDQKILLTLAVQLQRALLVNRVASPLTEAVPRMIAAAAPNAAWASIADLLTRPILGPHDLELCRCNESEAALQYSDTADVLLATYAPDARLEQLALTRIVNSPGAFWPRITAGRAALLAGKITATRTHALVALGADPDSLWPHLLLAYAALAEGLDEELLHESSAGLLANPQHLELQALHAVALAHLGHLDQAQALIDGLHQTPHFLHHINHRTGHPMEATVDALRIAGIIFGDEPQPGH